MNEAAAEGVVVSVHCTPTVEVVLLLVNAEHQSPMAGVFCSLLLSGCRPPVVELNKATTASACGICFKIKYFFNG